MTKPIRPEEVTQKKIEATPAAVFAAFNELIAENWDGTKSIFSKNDVAARIGSKLAEGREVQMSWLDVEDSYREYGWSVSYEKPDYTEGGNAKFTFKKGRKRG